MASPKAGSGCVVKVDRHFQEGENVLIPDSLKDLDCLLNIQPPPPFVLLADAFADSDKFTEVIVKEQQWHEARISENYMELSSDASSSDFFRDYASIISNFATPENASVKPLNLWLMVYANWYALAWTRWFGTYDYTYINRHFQAAARLCRCLQKSPYCQKDETADAIMTVLEKAALGMAEMVLLENSLANQSLWEMCYRAGRAEALWQDVINSLGTLKDHEEHWLLKGLAQLAHCYWIRAGIKCRFATVMQLIPCMGEAIGKTGNVLAPQGDFFYAAYCLTREMTDSIDKLEETYQDSEGASNIRGHRGTLEAYSRIPSDIMNRNFRIRIGSLEGAVHFFIHPDLLRRTIFNSEKGCVDFLEDLKRELLPLEMIDEDPSWEEVPVDDMWETPISNRNFFVCRFHLKDFQLIEGICDDIKLSRLSYRVELFVEFTTLGPCSIRFSLKNMDESDFWLYPNELRRIISLLTPLAGQNTIHWGDCKLPQRFRYLVRHKDETGEVLTAFLVDKICSVLDATIINKSVSRDKDGEGLELEEKLDMLKEKRVCAFNPHMDWFVWAYSPEIRDKDGHRVGYREIKDLPWFKALSVHLRESRSSIGDWIAVSHTSEMNNIAYIKSHENELMLIDSDRAVLVMSDTPYFLVVQNINIMIESSRLICLMNGMDSLANYVAKMGNDVIEKCTEALERDQWEETDSFKKLSTIRIIMMEQETRLLDVLQLIEAVRATAYHDNAIYMAAVQESMGIPRLARRTKEMLELLRSQIERWTALVNGAMEKEESQREKRQEKKFTLLIGILGLTGLIEAYYAIFPGLSSKYEDKILVHWHWLLVILVGMIVAAIAVLGFTILTPPKKPKKTRRRPTKDKANMTEAETLSLPVIGGEH